MTNRQRNDETIRVLQNLGYDLSLERQAGGARVFNREGSKTISPRLPEKELRWWLEGYAYAAATDAAMLMEIKTP